MVGAARADVAWLQPERFAVTPGALLRIDAVTGSTFDTELKPVAARAVKELVATIANQPAPNGSTGGATAPGDAGARFSIILPRPGVAVVSVEMKPDTRELPRESVDRYLNEIHATDEVRREWDDMVAAEVWRETRVVRLKTYVRVGDPGSEDRSWAQPSDTGLDLIPQANPTALHENDALAVLVAEAGSPMSGAVVTYLSRGENREHVVVTGDDGRATAKLDAAGPWLIQTVDLRRDGATRREWRVRVVAATLDVR